MGALKWRAAQDQPVCIAASHFLAEAAEFGFSHGDPQKNFGVCTTRPSCDAAGGYEPEPSAQVLLQPRSLLVFSGDAYSECLHGIDEVRNKMFLPKKLLVQFTP